LSRCGLRYPSDLTDTEWAIVEPMIPPARHGAVGQPYSKRFPTWHHEFHRSNGVSDFVDQNGMTLFVEHNGVFLGTSAATTLVLSCVGSDCMV
jgi:hypothetical protein